MNFGQSGFRQGLGDDIDRVFLDLDIFGEVLDIDGTPVRAVIDDSHAAVSSGGAQGLSDASGLGLMKEVRTLYMEDVLRPRPVPEQLLTINGRRWQVCPDGTAVKEEMGILVVELQRVYA